MIITGNKIIAARCVLPLTNNPQFPSDLGLRHRASVGISEHTDALCIIVSEQTGNISLAESGNLTTNISVDQIKGIIYSKLSS